MEALDLFLKFKEQSVEGRYLTLEAILPILKKLNTNNQVKQVGHTLEIHYKMNVVDDDQFIFVNKFGTKPIDKSYVNVKLKELFKKYDIHLEGNVSSHLFRKTLGNRALKLNNYSNESIILLMELFNHSSPITTKRYLGVRNSEIESIYDSLKL